MTIGWMIFCFLIFFFVIKYQTCILWKINIFLISSYLYDRTKHRLYYILYATKVRPNLVFYSDVNHHIWLISFSRLNLWIYVSGKPTGPQYCVHNNRSPEHNISEYIISIIKTQFYVCRFYYTNRNDRYCLSLLVIPIIIEHSYLGMETRDSVYSFYLSNLWYLKQ